MVVRSAMSVALAIGLMLVPPTASVAGSASASRPSGATSDALLIDATNYAAYWNVSLKEAIGRLERQEEIGNLNAKLETELAPWFGGMWIEHAPYRVVVAHVGPKAVAAGQVLGGRLDRYIRFQARDVSLKTLLARLETARASLDPRTTHVDLDLPTGSLVVETLRGVDIEQSLARTGIDRGRFKVTQVASFGGPAVNIYGGLSANGCTFGFSVFKIGPPDDRPKGIMTAGHCPNAQSFNGQNLPFEQGSPDQTCCDEDAQWHTTPNLTDKNWVKDNVNGHTREITSRKGYTNLTVGETVCKFGANTGYNCGEIKSKTDAPPWIQNVIPVWIKIGRNNVILVKGGDSGGPFFLGLTAYGVTHGTYFEFFGTAEGVFGSITKQEQYLGVNVMTNP